MIDSWRNSISRLWQKPQIPLLAITWLGFWLRVHRLGDKAIWWDEGLAAWAARQSLPAMSQWTANDVHPPLYFWALYFWRMISGDTEFGLRLMSALVGTLTIPLTYLLGRAVGGKRAGLLAALLMSLSRFSIAWSQEMRMYALAALLAAGALWAALRVWNDGGRRAWAWYILFMTAGLYTLYLSVTVLVVANVIWLLLVLPRAGNKKRELLSWSAGQMVILLIVAPWLAYALGRIPTWTSAAPVALVDFIKIYWTVLVLGIPLNVDAFARFTWPVAIIFSAGTAVLLWPAQHRFRQARDTLLLLLGLLLPAIIVYLVSLPKETFFYAPQIAPRYLIIFLAAYAVLLAWGIIRLGRGRLWPVALLSTGIVLLAAVTGLRSYHPGRVLVDDYKSLGRTLAVYERPTDAVVLYTDRDWPIFAYHHPGEWHGVPFAWQITPEQAGNYLSPIWESHDGVWLVVTPYAGVGDPQGHLPGWLAERATAVSRRSYGDKELVFYARTAQRAVLRDKLLTGASPQYPGSAAPTQFQGFDQAAHDYSSGDDAHLGLYWSGTTATYPLAVGLIKQDETFVASFPLENSPIPGIPALDRQEITVRIPPETPSGAYAFFLMDEQDQRTTFGEFQVRQRFGEVLLPADVHIPHRLNGDFGDNVRLLGYAVETENPQPGGTLFLTLYWQAQGPVSQRYKVFTHLLGDVFNAETENFLWGQQDNEPVNLSRPTTGWRVGEVIVDSYAIPIAAHAVDGTYRLEIGLYDPASGVRLPLLGEDGSTAVSDHLILTTIDITRE